MERPRFDGMREFDREILPGLLAIPFFRRPTEHEIAASFAAYEARDWHRLVAVWKSDCAATRAEVSGWAGAVYERAHLLPRGARRASFLASLRAVLAAGRDFFDRQLPPEMARAIRAQFSWLEKRHEHVPDGWTPRLRFPSEFARWVAQDGLDEAKARFQLAALLNEVQQHAYSLHLAERMALPELARHAERERQMAIAYCERWAPPATHELWRQTILVLDGLNAAVFAMACKERALGFPAGSMWQAITSFGARGEWERFVRAMDTPPAL